MGGALVNYVAIPVVTIKIGEAVGGMSGYAVAKGYQRLVAEMGKDAALRKEADALSRQIVSRQGLTPTTQI